MQDGNFPPEVCARDQKMLRKNYKIYSQNKGIEVGKEMSDAISLLSLL